MQIDQRRRMIMTKINDVLQDIDLLENEIRDPKLIHSKKFTAARKHIFIAGCILERQTKND
jgi:hypothetical protein